jgi:hypothetical protein
MRLLAGYEGRGTDSIGDDDIQATELFNCFLDCSYAVFLDAGVLFAYCQIC